MPQYKHILTDFKDLRKVIGEITKSQPAKSRYQQQVEKMGYPLPLIEDKGMTPAEIDRLRKAYTGIKTINPTNPAGKKLLAFMQKLSKEQLLDLAAAGINFISLLAVSNLIKMGVKPADINYTKAETNEGIVDESKMGDLLIDIQQGATAKELVKYHNISLQTAKNFLSDYYGNKKSRAAPGLKKESIKEANLQEEMIQDFEIRFDKESDWKKAGKMVKDYLRTQAPKHAKTLLTKTSVIGPDPMMVAVGDTNQKLKPPVNLNKLYNSIRKLPSSRMKYWMGIPKKDEPIAVGENIQEGTWAVPDSREKIEKLNNWLSQPRRIKVEKEADLVWNTISGIVGDDGVADEWNTMISMGFQGKTGDARAPVVDWLKEWGFKLSGYQITHAPASYLEGVGESKEQTEGSFSQGWRKLKKKGRIKKPMKKPTKLESREDRLKEQKEHAKQSPFKLKSQQYPRAIAINTDGFGKRHATVEDIITACDSFGMIIDKELQVEQIQKELGKKGFISYNKQQLEDIFEERETERMILVLESEVEDQEPIEYVQGEIAYHQLHEHEIEFLKPDGTKSVGPILKMSGKTYNVKDKFTGKSFTYKYSNKLEENKVDYEKSWTKPGQGLKSYKELIEASFSPALINKAIKITKDKKYYHGDYDGAIDAIEKLKKGLADDPKVKKALAKSAGFESVTEVSIGDAGIQKDFPNVWAQKDKRLNSILMALVNAHGFMDNLKSYKKNPKKFIDSLKAIGKNDASLKKAGLTKKNIGEWVSKSGARRRVKERDQRKSGSKKTLVQKVEAKNDWKNWIPEGGDKEAYQKFFNAALKKFGVSSPAELEGDKKKEFFNYVDKNWKADHEEVDIHKSYRVDGRRKNFKEKMRKLGYTKSRF
jgi:hypothetical protein